MTENHSEQMIPFKQYYEAMRIADEKLANERDRRYAEVKAADEKAIRVKEVADERALRLQAETQQYKDEKANELRSQIESERGTYTTHSQLNAVVESFQAAMKALDDKWDAQHKPVVEFMAAFAGEVQQKAITKVNINLIIGVLAFLAALGIMYTTFHH